MTEYYKALKRDRFATYVDGFQWPEGYLRGEA